MAPDRNVVPDFNTPDSEPSEDIDFEDIMPGMFYFPSPIWISRPDLVICDFICSFSFCIPQISNKTMAFCISADD